MDTTPAPRPAPASPIAPTRGRLHPISLDEYRITGGPWAKWQTDNSQTSIPHAVRWLERDGSVNNLRRLAPGAVDQPERQGLWFTDSDVYKLMEGAAWELGRPDGGDRTEVARIVAELTGIVAAAQAEDGYLSSYVQAGLEERWLHLQHSHELYCMGHLMQAAVAHHRATGERGLLDVAIAAADCLVRDFGEGRRPESDGHAEIEMALVELYRETGRQAYLDLASQFVDGRGHNTFKPTPQFPVDPAYLQDDIPIREQTTVIGHAVRALYLLAGAADVAVETDDQVLLDAVVRQWESMVATKLYVTGALGSRPSDEAFSSPFELPPDTGYGETCATIGQIMLSWRLLLATGESRYDDEIERGLYNLFAASTSLDRTGFFYNNPGHRRFLGAPAPTDTRPERAEAPGTRPVWFACACCPPNVIRTVASLAGYAATHDEGGVQLHQFLPGSLTVPTAFGQVGLHVTTDYPASGVIAVAIDETPDSAWTLAFRRPAWASGAAVEIREANGVAIADPGHVSDQDGWVRVNRRWQQGDTATLTLPMAPRLIVGHPAIDAVRGTVAVARGPVVYALESHDQPEGVDLETVRFDPTQPLTEVVAEIAGEPTLALQGVGTVPDLSAFTGSAWADGAEHLSPAAARTVPLTFIPYALWANRGPSLMRVHVPVATS